MTSSNSRSSSSSSKRAPPLPPSRAATTTTTSTSNSSSAPTQQLDSLRQYITARDTLKRSTSFGTPNTSERTSTDPAVGSTSQPTANSPRRTSTTAVTAMSSDSMASTATTASSLTSTSSPKPDEYLLKVVLIGDSGVGKSNLVLRFTKNKYAPSNPQTVGFEFATKMLRVGDRRIKAQIWDTAGHERFQSLTAAYYRNAVGAMLVYDITDRRSFESIAGWLTQIHAHAHASLALVLVGNKCDLAHLPQTRQVSTLEAARFAALHSMDFVEASALDATNVVDAFKKLIVPVGRLLTPTHAHAPSIAKLPPGWRRVLSRTRPGEYSYENQYTKERIAFVPKEPAKPSQQSFRPLVASAASSSTASTSRVGHNGVGSSSGLAGVGSSSSSSGAVAVTVTRESLQRQHQKAFLAQNHSPPCGVCTPVLPCTIL